MKKKQSKRGRQTRRMQSWDYSRPGYYFITMVVRNRKHAFGEIRDGVMHKTLLGEFAEKAWKDTPSHRPRMNLSLGDFVVMPDHFHAILFIGENEFNRSKCFDVYQGRMDLESLDEKLSQKNGFHPQSNNLGAVVRGFKSAVTMEARRQGIPFDWVTRYHDSIVRSTGDLLFVRRYIRLNVQNWWMKAHQMLKNEHRT